MPEFTVEEILSAAEKNKYPNFNNDYIDYEYTQDNKGGYNKKPVFACVIGEAFLNLGLVENGTDARALSGALRQVIPDDGQVVLDITTSYKDYYSDKMNRNTETFRYDNLSDFINDLNSFNGYRGKKRIARLARKYFSKSLEQVVRF